MTETLNAWRDFYSVLGEASATMVALLFVAASVGSGIFSHDRPAALRMFLSASVVHFSGILAISLIVLAPLRMPILIGGLVAAAGVFGLAYYALAWFGAPREGFRQRIDLEDRIWYTGLPITGYLLETAAGAAMVWRPDLGCSALAVAVGALLIVGIHNAWDITVWSIAKRRE